MSLHVTEPEVQQWLETTKLDITSVDVELEATAFEVVASALQGRYVTTSWTTDGNTPPLIRKIIAMLVAGFIYNRQYSENLGNDRTYGTWLIDYAKLLLQALADGTDDLVGLDSLRASFSYPVVWPNDVATDLADPALGGDRSDPAGAPRYFSMGQTF